MKKIRIIPCVISLFLAVPGFAGPNYDDVEMRTTPVSGAVYMVQGSGGNIAVSAGEDGIIIVDDEFAPLADKIRREVQKIHPGRIKFVLNTHWHQDHTGGNEEFGREAVIIAHENVRKRLSAEQFIEFLNKTVPPLSKEGLPVITFKDSVSIHFNGERIDVIHLKTGHTDGDSVIFFRGSNVVHVGDHFFNGTYPFVDIDSGGSVEGFAENVEELIRILPDDARIIPGHGPLADKEDLVRFYKMILETKGMVENGIKKGKSLEEIKKEGFPERITGKWSKGFLNTGQWIEIIYNDHFRSEDILE